MKRVLITGASSGIGRQLALDYQADGWQVTACGRDQTRLAELAAADIETLTFDSRVLAECQRAADTAGELDLLILNAGSCEYIDDAQHFDSLLFARVMETNLIATGHALAAFLPRLRRGGRLALVSSSVTWLALPRAEAYGASKAALDYLAASLRVDLASRDIHVSLVKPGFVATPLTARNDFPMPALLTPEQASCAIRHGLARGQHTVAFPRRLVWGLRLLGALPTGWWLRLSRFLTRPKDVSA